MWANHEVINIRKEAPLGIVSVPGDTAGAVHLPVLSLGFHHAVALVIAVLLDLGVRRLLDAVARRVEGILLGPRPGIGDPAESLQGIVGVGRHVPPVVRLLLPMMK